MQHASICLMLWEALARPSMSMLAHVVYTCMKPYQCAITHKTWNSTEFTKCYCSLLFYASLCYYSLLILAKYKLLCICCYICHVFTILELWFVNRPVWHNGPSRLQWTKPSLPIQHSYSTSSPFQQPMISYWVWAWGTVLKKGPTEWREHFAFN